jgi:aldehyde dehydrogenase (NAD+)
MYLRFEFFRFTFNIRSSFQVDFLIIFGKNNHIPKKMAIPLNRRKELLKNLSLAIKRYESEINNALKKDFGKPEFESFLTETYFVLSDISHTLKNINKWTKPKKVLPTVLNFPSSEYIYPEPYGKVLIISPWNYPFQLAFSPLIAAIAAGNSVVLKPSELTVHTSQIISDIVKEVFDVKEALVVLGGAEFTQLELKKKWDYIFFTGSVKVGKIVAKAAAQNLTPVTLELGGKNPCIVDESANLKITARRIVWAKFVNAGQTCIAPDYLLVHSSVKEKLIVLLKNEILRAYGDNPEESADFARIINSENWKRIVRMIDPEKTIFGGKTNDWERYIAPTIIDEPELSDPVMEVEIFGPLLPIISYQTHQDIDNIINYYQKPLALYVFSNKKDFSEKIISKYSFGGGCINDCMIQFANKNLPFGGVGNSGIGAYHGKYGFDTFSHKKSIVRRVFSFDVPARYAPYRGKKWIVKLLKYLQ